MVIPARDRAGLGRLARYMLRPPLVGPRVERQPDGSVVLTLKRPWANGTTTVLFDLDAWDPSGNTAHQVLFVEWESCGGAALP